MVYLIGGSSHVGKTFFAQKLLERTHYPYLSLDHIKMGFIRSGRTNLTIADDVEMRSFLWPFVAEIIKTVLEKDQNLIIEGCYIPETWRESFSKEELEKIRCVFLVMSEEYLRANFADVKKYANVMERRIDDAPDLERLIACSKGFRADCEAYGIPCMEINRFDPDILFCELCEAMGI